MTRLDEDEVETEHMYSIAKRFRFSAAHVLHSPALSGAQNAAVYGKCAGPSGHGHDYTIEVIVGRQSLDNDVVITRRWLEVEAAEALAGRFAFTNLNETFGRDFIPTGENLAEAAWRLLRPHLPSENSLTVRLVETPKNAFVYRGDGEQLRTQTV
ncbi:MAG: 6-carboxytetrahydropterin synthase [candidate division Zixibacteria bacterium]|nr:6-carboxytetrahydropterin synthase [candidate division Zixibacteria bacterium]